jgi:hypothetical protein
VSSQDALCRRTTADFHHYRRNRRVSQHLWAADPTAILLDLLGDLIDLRIPNLHICITSRPEIDIKTVLEPLAYSAVSLHDESGQKQDISDYVHTVVNSDRKMRQWRDADKKLVVKVLSEKADGM